MIKTCKMDGEELPDMLLWWDNWQHTGFPASDWQNLFYLQVPDALQRRLCCIMIWGVKHIRELKDLVVRQRLWHKRGHKHKDLVMRQRFHVAQIHYISLLFPQKQAHIAKRRVCHETEAIKWSEWMVQAPSGMEGAPSLWQNHLPLPALDCYCQSRQVAMKAQLCFASLQWQKWQAMSRNGTQERVQTRAWGIIAEWKLLFFPVCDPNITEVLR